MTGEKITFKVLKRKFLKCAYRKTRQWNEWKRRVAWNLFQKFFKLDTFLSLNILYTRKELDQLQRFVYLAKENSSLTRAHLKYGNRFSTLRMKITLLGLRAGRQHIRVKVNKKIFACSPLTTPVKLFYNVSTAYAQVYFDYIQQMDIINVGLLCWDWSVKRA